MRHFLLCAIILNVLALRGLTAPPSTPVPAYTQAVIRGAEFIRGHLKDTSPTDGYESLAVYALLKAGEPKNSPFVKRAVDTVRRKIKDGKYKVSGINHGYVAGIDAMFLAAAGKEEYQTELAAIAEYLGSSQLSNGSWDYGGQETGGDTSMVQYAALGLWAAAQAGVDVPTAVWDRIASWQLRTQNADGGFGYKPGNREVHSALNMTANAASTLAIIKLNLHPETMKPNAQRKKSSKKYGVLEARSEPTDADAAGTAKAAPRRAQTPAGALDGSARRGIGWLSNRYRPLNEHKHGMYYVYAIERAFGLNKVEQLGTTDWYRTTGDALLKAQGDDGSWPGGTAERNDAEPTAYAVLFFVRATKQAVEAQFGAGLFHGGRGIDLENADIGRDGKVKEKRKSLGPLDDLLADLSKQDPEALFAAQEAIVEKIQLGDRKELLGQIERIRKLITNENPEIRRTAVWALGRSGDLRDAYLLINALEDTDVDVLVEAYNALSYLSRKISGVGIPSNPLADLPDGASQVQIDATVDRWRREALKRWSAWYFRVRPYEERNDLFELRFGAAIGNTGKDR